MKNPNTVYYMMECGCRLEKHQLKTNRNPYHFTCPDHHGSKISYKQTVCPGCGKTFDFYYRSHKPDLCKTCAYELVLQRAKEQKLKQKGKPLKPKESSVVVENRQKFSSENHSCPRRDTCLDETTEREPLANYLDCYKCEMAIQNQRRCA